MIICVKDMNVRAGEHDEPKVVGYKEMFFDTKEDLMKEYQRLINNYMEICHDFKGYSQGAVKFFHDKNTLTYLLVHYNGEEVMEGLFD